ncbi:MAG TPA: GIY-YIG nuclease family protein [Saprospiraceae bacterium]|nr:GIY-YIG nuclease family protein [Saprospiraceae bacterium]
MPRRYFKNDIIRRAIAIEPAKVFIVYFLIDGGEIVYIGQSVAFGSRLHQHISDKSKKFDRYFTIKCKDKSEMDELEMYYISAFKPAFNTNGVGVHELEKRKIKKILPDSELEPIGELPIPEHVEKSSVHPGTYIKRGEYYYFNLDGHFRIPIGSQPFKFGNLAYRFNKLIGNIKDCILV